MILDNEHLTQTNTKEYQVGMTLTILATDIDEADEILDEVLCELEDIVWKVDTAILEETVNGD